MFGWADCGLIGRARRNRADGRQSTSGFHAHPIGTLAELYGDRKEHSQYPLGQQLRIVEISPSPVEHPIAETDEGCIAIFLGGKATASLGYVNAVEVLAETITFADHSVFTPQEIHPCDAIAVVVVNPHLQFWLRDPVVGEDQSAPCFRHAFASAIDQLQ